MNLENIDFEVSNEIAKKSEELSDRWIISRLNQVSKEISNNIDKFELGIAADKIYDFAWSEFCDWYIEIIKSRLYGEDIQSKQYAISTAKYILTEILKLLHPFMPFITEEIYSKINDGKRIIIANWFSGDGIVDEKAIALMNKIMGIIKSIRNVRAEMNVPPSKKAQILIQTVEVEELKKGIEYFKTLASASNVKFISKDVKLENVVSLVAEETNVHLPLDELVDIEKEIIRLEKEKVKFENEIKKAEGKLNNKGFVDKAPQNLIEEEKVKIQKYNDMLQTVIKRIEELKK